MRVGRLIPALLAICAASVATAQTDASDLAARAAREMDAASQSLRAAEGSDDRVAALTRSVRAYEAGLTALREGLRRATEQEAALLARLDGQSAQLGQLLGTLQTMGVAPEALLLLHPEGPVNTARAGMLIRDVTPAVLGRVAAVRADLTEVSELRALQDDARAQLATGLSDIQTARAQLSQAVSDRTDLPSRLADDDRIEALARAVDTLYAFAAQLPDLPAGAQADFARAEGDLALPVRGRRRLGFDMADGAGIRRPGWTIDTAPGALVTAPWPGTIRYRGPLLDYGNVMILEPGPGYLVVLAGLGVVYGETGQIVGAGDPLGLMPGAEGARDAAFLPADGQGAGQTRPETLYVEIRQDNSPVDPATWFADTQG